MRSRAELWPPLNFYVPSVLGLVMISIGLLIFHVDILVSFTDGLDQLKIGRFWTQVRLEIHTLRCQVS